MTCCKRPRRCDGFSLWPGSHDLYGDLTPVAGADWRNRLVNRPEQLSFVQQSQHYCGATPLMLDCDQLKARQVAVLWVNNDFGKGGRDAFIREMNARNIKVVGDISTEQWQVDFAADVAKLKSVPADAVFVYTNEEESARFLLEARRQGLTNPLIGEKPCSARR